MTMRAVRNYIVEQLDGLKVLDMEPLTMHAYTPPVEAMAGPMGWLLIRQVPQKRVSGPRGMGQRERNYQVWLSVMTQIDTGNDDPGQFDDLVEEIVDKLGSLPVNTNLVDSVSGRISSLIRIGETITPTIEPPADLGSGTLSYLAFIEFDACEWVTG